MNITRKTLLVLAVGAALVVEARILIGPFRFVLPVHSPLNAEGVFGLAITILLLTAPRASSGSSSSNRYDGRTVALAVCAVVLLIIAAFVRSLGVYFLSDDFILIKYASDATPQSLAAQFATPGGDGFFRPLGAVAFALEAYWAGVDPFRWHAVGVALHVVNSVLVYFLAARLCPSPLAAFFAGALFGIHGIHTEAVVWIAARFDLLATLFVLTGLLLFLRSCDSSGARVYMYRTAALAAMTLAMLSKESAYIFPVLLLVCLRGCRASIDRVKALVPFFLTAGAIFAYRWSLFHGIGGYLLGGRPQALQLGVASTLKALGMRLWTVLYFPINWSLEPGPLFGLIALAGLVCTLVLAATTKSADPLLPVAFVLVAVIPPLHLLLIGPDLGKSRILYLPSVGFCLLLACALDGLRAWRRLVVLAVLLLCNLAFLQRNLRNWVYASARVKTACAFASEYAQHFPRFVVENLPATIRGVPTFANFRVCVAMARKHPTVGVDGISTTGSLDADSTVLTWDATADELRCSRRCLPAELTR